MAAAPRHRHYERVVLHLTEAGRDANVFPLAPGRNLIGRGEDCQVQLDDYSVSRQHAAVTVEQTIQLEDLGSASGTILNGRLLVGPDYLFDNDEFKVGPFALRLEVRRREGRLGVILGLLCLLGAGAIFAAAMLFPEEALVVATTGADDQKEAPDYWRDWHNWETYRLPTRADLDHDAVEVSERSARNQYQLGLRLYQDRLGDLGNASRAIGHFKRCLGICQLLPPNERPAVIKSSLDRLGELRHLIDEDCRRRVFGFRRAYELGWWNECRRTLREISAVSPWPGCRYRRWAESREENLKALLGE